MQPYRYSYLVQGELRLIWLLPESTRDAIHSVMEYRRLPAADFQSEGLQRLNAQTRDAGDRTKLAPQFAALSYVCGGGPPTEAISVNDRSFAVRPNLAFLRAYTCRRLSERLPYGSTLCVSVSPISQKRTPKSSKCGGYTAVQAAACLG
jgi:hypothetical protein